MTKNGLTFILNPEHFSYICTIIFKEWETSPGFAPHSGSYPMRISAFTYREWFCVHVSTHTPIDFEEWQLVDSMYITRFIRRRVKNSFWMKRIVTLEPHKSNMLPISRNSFANCNATHNGNEPTITWNLYETRKNEWMYGPYSMAATTGSTGPLFGAQRFAKTEFDMRYFDPIVPFSTRVGGNGTYFGIEV